MKYTKTSPVFGNKGLTDSITMAAQAFASFSEFRKSERESLLSLPNLPPVRAEGSARLRNLRNLPFSEFGSQSNTNSECSKSTVFKIGTNQTQPKNLAGWNLEQQPFNQERIQAALEKPRFFYASFYCTTLEKAQGNL